MAFHGMARLIAIPALFVVAAIGVQSLSATAHADDKDLQLRKLADRSLVDGGSYTATNRDTEAFKLLSRDLGLVFAPRYLSPAETLGQAGFDVGLSMSFTTTQAGDHWRALEGSNCKGDTPSTNCNAYDPGGFLTGQIQVRKGLPFSFELGGTLTHLFESELVALGTDIKWSLNEGFFLLPDFAVRGSVNNVVGSSDMNLTNGGFDVSVSKAFGVAGVVNITPYAGWNRLWIFSSSRLLDVAPEDPTPPTLDENGDLLASPEFVFDSETQSVDRYFVGMRFLFVRASLTFEGAFADGVNSYTGRVGLDF